MSLWCNCAVDLSLSVQMISVLVDKLIRTQIVDCAAVANWLFSPNMAHEFTRWVLNSLCVCARTCTFAVSSFAVNQIMQVSRSIVINYPNMYYSIKNPLF